MDARDMLFLALCTHGPLTIQQATACYRRLNPDSRAKYENLDHLIEDGLLIKLSVGPGQRDTYTTTPAGREQLAKFFRWFAPMFSQGERWLQDASRGVFDEVVSGAVAEPADSSASPSPES